MSVQVKFSGEPSVQEATIRAALEARFHPSRFPGLVEASVHYSGDRFEAKATAASQDMSAEVQAIIQSVGGKVRSRRR
jgi:hypothetical protein